MVSLDSDHVYQPNDAFFKQYFSDPRLAKSFFQAYVPDDLLASIDLDSIRLMPQTLVDAMMKELRANVIYEVQFKKYSQTGYMIFHLEHVRHEVAQIKSAILRCSRVAFKPLLPLFWCRIGNDSVLSRIESLTKYQSGWEIEAR